MSVPLPPVAILAGGLATRLLPLTAALPKSLVPVAGKPFLAHQLELLRAQGFARVVLCVGHFGEQIEAAFGDGRAAGLRLEYSYDGNTQRGTAGALRRAAPRLGEAFLTLYGDSYLEIDYRAVWRAFLAADASALMTVIEKNLASESPNVRFEGGLVSAYGKNSPTVEMTHVDYGANVFRTVLFRDATSEPASLSDLQGALAARGRLAGLEITQPYFEIGSPRGLAALESHLRAGPAPS